MTQFETMQNPGSGSGSMQFDESQFKLRSRRLLGAPEIPTMIRFLVGKRFVKNENQAVMVLLGLCAILIIATVIVFNSSAVSTAIISPNL